MIAMPPSRALALSAIVVTVAFCHPSRAAAQELRSSRAEARDSHPSNAAAPDAMTAARAIEVAKTIARQIQPCADRGRSPGAGAEDIVVTLRLELNQDGSLARPPEVAAVRSTPENAQYVDQVKAAAVAAFTDCSPIKGLPHELYDVPRGWKRFKMNYKLPG